MEFPHKPLGGIIMFQKISRRAFLKSAGLTCASVVFGGSFLSTVYEASCDIELPNTYRRINDLVILPDRGILYIAADFHTRFKDFKIWLQQTNIVEKIKDNEDAYGLILGDTVDKKPGDRFAEKHGDSRIVENLMKTYEELGENSHRLIYIMGNHEDAVVELYDKLVKLGMNAQNRKNYVAKVYNGASGLYYRQFNFIERITEAQYQFLKNLPLAVSARNGLIAVHGAPAKHAVNLESLANADATVRKEILWNRLNSDHSVKDTKRFLRRMSNARILVVGHTPLRYLPQRYIKKGLGMIGDEEIILATSYGWQPGKKSYLVLDLGTVYNDVHKLRVGKEIRRLSM